MDPWLVDIIGYVGAGVDLFVYISNTMMPLRVAAITSSTLFTIYFFFKGFYPPALLNAALIGVNVWRLGQLRSLLRAIRAATQGDFDYKWLRPFMNPLTVAPGATLYRKGDLAEVAYVIVRGDVYLPEAKTTLGPGTLFGEIGLFTDNNRRTASAVAVGELELLSISYTEVLQLTTENPQFGFYLMRLMVQRLSRNAEAMRQRQDL